MTFSNPEIAIETLPNFATIDYVHTRQDYPLIWLRVTLCTYLALILLVAVPLFLFAPDVAEQALYGPPRYISLTIVALAAFQVWHGYRWARIVSYGIREHDVVLRSGVFWRKETVQPLKRLQHVEVVQGPIEKRCDLCKVKLFSAGTVNSTFVIPGLDQALGNRLREFVLAYRSPADSGSEEEQLADTNIRPVPVAVQPLEELAPELLAEGAEEGSEGQQSSGSSDDQ